MSEMICLSLVRSTWTQRGLTDSENWLPSQSCMRITSAGELVRLGVRRIPRVRTSPFGPRPLRCRMDVVVSMSSSGRHANFYSESSSLASKSTDVDCLKMVASLPRL